MQLNSNGSSLAVNHLPPIYYSCFIFHGECHCGEKKDSFGAPFLHQSLAKAPIYSLGGDCSKNNAYANNLISMPA